MSTLQKSDPDYMRKAFEAYTRYSEVHVGLTALDHIEEHRALDDEEEALRSQLRQEKQELEDTAGADILSP